MSNSDIKSEVALINTQENARLSAEVEQAPLIKNNIFLDQLSRFSRTSRFEKSSKSGILVSKGDKTGDRGGQNRILQLDI